MCDEYDEERMRVFWRQLVMQEELADLEPKAVDVPRAEPVIEVLEPSKARPRALIR